MSSQLLKFKVYSLRTQSSPYNRTDDDTFETIYYLLVNMKVIPDDIPLDVNPRVPDMRTNVAKSIAAAVTEPECDFYLNNRGIAISAKSLTFDTTKSQVTIDLGDQESETDKFQYGILDGGHTYKAIISERENISDDIEKYVRIEVITNVQNITRLSDARNKSRQVTDIALFNLDDKFEDIKMAIKDQPYADWVAYKDNDKKDIHISELLRLMYAFDIEKYPDDSAAPVQSFSGKAQVFKRYAACHDTPLYKSLTKHIPKLVTLFDKIEQELPMKYNEYKKAKGDNPKFGKVRGIESCEAKKSPTIQTATTFLHNKMTHKISSGYIYPIFGAFRCLLRFNSDNQEVFWLFDPIDLWEEVGTSLVRKTFETSNNPQLAGKDTELWLSNYGIVETQSLRKLLNQNK